MILSNRGTLAVVLNKVEIVASKSLDRCDPTDDEAHAAYEKEKGGLPMVLEPETVTQLDLEFYMKKWTLKADKETEKFDLPPPEKQMYCLRWTLFDPNGRRHEPLTPLVTVDSTYVMKQDKKYPEVQVEKDFPRGPTKLVARGVY